MYDPGFFQVSNNSAFINFSDSSTTGNNLGRAIRVDPRETRKPIEVWNELKQVDTPIVDCADLDAKIKIIKDRIKTLSEYAGTQDLQEEYEVLGYLEARKKYAKLGKLFAYPTTNEDLLRALCKKYKLMVAPINQYSGTMPQEAIEELKKVTAACKKIRSDKPIVRLVVPENEPQVQKKKRDPILLVSSPFGKWDYICGVWDMPVEIVDEIIYDGK